MGKGRLALALLKRYARDHPDASFNDVQAAFPDKLQADSPMQFAAEQCVVARLDGLSDSARRRFFIGDGERIELSDGVAVVSREWNLHNIQNLLGRKDDDDDDECCREA